MEPEALKKLITTNWSHILFTYKDKECGIDPFSLNSFDMWYGDELENFTSLDDLMSRRLFDGKSLSDICFNLKFEY